MGAATTIIFVSVAHRYLSGLSIPGLQDWLLSLNFGWAQELCIIMFVWMAKFGAAYGVRTGIHVGVDVLINRMDEQMRGKFVIFGLLAGALFTGIVGTLGAHFVWENGFHYAFYTLLGWDWSMFPKGRRRPISSGRPGSSTVRFRSGSSLMCFRFLQVTVSFIRPASCRITTTATSTASRRKRLPRRSAFQMEDNLHPHDLTYQKHHPEDRPGKEARNNERHHHFHPAGA
jgi:C4-dicarboxylate transporter DctQ subunit